MLKLLRLLGLSADNDLARGSANDACCSPTSVQSAIDMVVDGTEPRIRPVSGYRKKLQEGAATALSYINQLVDTIPAAIRVDSQSYQADPNVNAFFAGTDELQKIFSDSDELNGFFASHEHDNIDDAYALLCMTQREKSVLGVEMQGDVLRRDVLQTAVNFYDHAVLSPAASEEEIRNSLKHCIFNGLITHALRRIADSKLHLNELADQRRILFNRLRTRMAKGDKLTTLLSSIPLDADTEGDIGAQLAETEQTLRQLPAYQNAPKAYLDEVNDVLMHPEQFIRLRQYDMTLTKMCIKAEGDVSEPINTIHLNEIEIADVLKRDIAIVRYPRSEMRLAH